MPSTPRPWLELRKRRWGEGPPRRRRGIGSWSSFAKALLRIHRAITFVHPPFDSAGDVHDVAESCDGEQLGRHFAVGGCLAVDQHGLILIRQQLRELPLNRLERRVDGAGTVTIRPTKCGA